MTESAKKKANFRRSKKWTEFRKKKMIDQKGKDYITKTKLSGHWNLHHCDMRPEHYEDLSNEDNFVCLLSSIHDVVHTLYRYYRKDKNVINRLLEVLERMENCENGLENKETENSEQ